MHNFVVSITTMFSYAMMVGIEKFDARINFGFLKVKVKDVD